MKNKKDAKKKNILFRLLSMIKGFYPVMIPVVVVCIIFSAALGALSAVFVQKVISVIEVSWQSQDWNGAFSRILFLVILLIVFDVLSLLCAFTYTQMMAVITEGSMKKIRDTMFNKMQSFPIKYFDTKSHGDIMSHYTNDTDTLLQMVSQSFPQLLVSVVTVLTVFSIMIYYSVWMTLVVLAGAFSMILVTKKIGGNSAKYFMQQQKALGEEEGFIEEMMNGQKVVKVFCHEEDNKAAFDSLNDRLFSESRKANKFANILGPVINNIGNLLYVFVALAGGILLIFNVPNLSLSCLPISISIVVPFLNMTKQFAGNVGQVSHQINAVVMGLAGSKRVFELLDEEKEKDEGYVTLVNAEEKDGVITECERHTGVWAWKHPHKSGEVTYTKLAGDIVLDDVDFQYEEGKTVLHNISLYAKPGQKIAFVGATGAGKTTITNLLNRFYDIADGKIRYDGININKIKKSDLRRSLGIVLQDTNLFTGTVMDNIRYGRLDASDDDCIAAAKLAGADDFITRLPNGYDTVISGNGSSLSQGQRQLLSISRAAVADPPVMILDEATSSVDTRTEAIIQKGMDALMDKRTVFVIAHRLSTVKNSDVIIVLDHGAIIEKGSHEQLIKQKGKYYQLYTGAFELE